MVSTAHAGEAAKPSAKSEKEVVRLRMAGAIVTDTAQSPRNGPGVRSLLFTFRHLPCTLARCFNQLTGNEE